MKTTPITVTAFEITDAPDLDFVRVILQDIGPGQGRITIECYGQAWSTYWGAMGDRTVGQFFHQGDDDYMVHKLQSGHLTKRAYAYLLKIVQAVQEALRQLTP